MKACSVREPALYENTVVITDVVFPVQFSFFRIYQYKGQIFHTCSFLLTSFCLLSDHKSILHFEHFKLYILNNTGKSPMELSLDQV